MNYRLLSAPLLILFFFTSAFAQEDKPLPLKPGRTLEAAQQKSYPDSAEFIKVFNELYPSIKPSLSVKAQAEADFKAISRTFKMQGIDSAKAAKVAYKNLDDSAFYKIYFQTYRRNLTAKELRKYMEFISTPEGKHISEVWESLQHVLSESMMYAQRTVNTNLLPIRQEARERMEKENPPKKSNLNREPLKPKPAPGTLFETNTPAASKDSLMRLQRLQQLVPPVKIPADSTH